MRQHIKLSLRYSSLSSFLKLAVMTFHSLANPFYPNKTLVFSILTQNYRKEIKSMWLVMMWVREELWEFSFILLTSTLALICHRIQMPRFHYYSTRRTTTMTFHFLAKGLAHDFFLRRKTRTSYQCCLSFNCYNQLTFARCAHISRGSSFQRPTIRLDWILGWNNFWQCQ